MEADKAKLTEFSDKEKKQFAAMDVVILSPIMIPQAKWVKCLADMMAYSWMQGLKIYAMGLTENMVVDWARNALAREAVDKTNIYTGKKFTHFLWLDADHTFNPDLACCLARHFDKNFVDAVTAIYYARSGPTLPVVFVQDKDCEDEHKHFPILDMAPTLCEVDAIGFGACLMKRDIFERVPEPWFTIDWRAGEDIAFCVKARKHGIRFFADGGYKLGHIGHPPVITEADYKQYLNEHKDIWENKVRVELGGARYV